ncbi:MAG: spore photoproduct lyase family protein [Planctomycetota bacterium]
MVGTEPVRRTRKTPFIKLFDRTPPGIVCPHFYILSHANGCPFSCDYCYLRLTLRYVERLEVFTNLDDLRREMAAFLSSMIPAVVSCGSLSDGLAFDHINGLSRLLVPMFARQDRHTLIFVTKSLNIGNLLDLDPMPWVVASFSVNCDAVSRRYEKGAPSPRQRLAAARRLKDAGWRIRLRLDPLLPIENWQGEYAAIIDEINALQPEIVTLLGFFYFPKILQHVREGREIFSLAREIGVDNRRRIPHPARLALYRFCLDRLSVPAVGLCKETLKMYADLGLDPGHVTCNCGTG